MAITFQGKSVSGTLFLIISSLLLLCLGIIAIILVSQPALFETMNLNNPSLVAIATVISGVTTPITGILSSWLIYMALLKQIESNASQNHKNDIDVVFLMLNQLDEEINKFRLTNTISKGQVVTEKEYNGFEALLRFAKISGHHQKDYIAGAMLNDTRLDVLIYLLQSFEMIFHKINNSNINRTDNDFLSQKLKLFYKTKLDLPAKIIVTNMKDYLHNSQFKTIADIQEKYSSIPESYLP